MQVCREHLDRIQAVFKMFYSDKQKIEDLYTEICKRIVESLIESRQSSAKDLLEIAKMIKNLLIEDKNA